MTASSTQAVQAASAAQPTVRTAAVVGGVLRSMRAPEWIKNTLVFAAALFSGNFFVATAFWHSFGAFVALCLVASATYLLNDVKDRELDRFHPRKCQRAIASGLVAPKVAIAVAVFLGVAGIALGFVVNMTTGITVLSYLTLTTLYTFLLKHMVILDVLALASVFVVRVIAGAEAVGVYFSSWLVLCTFLLALFLGFGKRRNELVALVENAQPHRPVLHEYSPHFLDMMMAIVTTATVMSYALYTMAPETIARFHSRSLIYTSVFVLYGIFRYLYLIHQKTSGGNPVYVFYRDWPLRITVVLWLLSVFLLRYWHSA